MIKPCGFQTEGDNHLGFQNELKQDDMNLQATRQNK